MMQHVLIAAVIIILVGALEWLVTQRRPKKSHDVHGDGFIMRHTHRWTRGGFLDHVPLEDPPTYRHTGLFVHVCDCDSWKCFPPENRALLTNGGTKALAKALGLSPANEIRETGR